MTGAHTPMAPVAFLPADRFVGFALPDVLDAAQCDELIGALARRGFAPTGGAYPRDYRDNDRLVFDDAELAARWFARVGARLPRELVVDGAAWRLHGLNPRFRACRYRGGQAFCVHRDGPHQPDGATRSLLTLQLYLDDASGMVGGRTRFYGDGAGHARWPAHAAAITSLARSPTGAWASSAEDGAVKIWRGDRLVRALPARDDFVTSVAFRADGALIATGYDGVVWEDCDVHAA